MNERFTWSFALLICAIAWSGVVDAQSKIESAAKDETGFTSYVEFGGTTNSAGQVYEIDSSAGYTFTEHFCVAAAHVSKNLPGMNFFCLRQAMTKTSAGTNAPSTACSVTGKYSLGQAIQKLDPQADSTTETKKAGAETQPDMKASGIKS